MTHFYRKSKIDANQREIVAALRQAGVSVLSLASLGDGCPDLVTSWRGRTVWIEVKRPGEKLRPTQVAWAATWDPHALWAVVESVEDALYQVGVLR